MKDTVLILKVSRYSMTDEKTGELIEGTKVTYCQSLESTQKQNSLGVEILTGTMPYEAYESFTQLPAFYDVEFRMKSNSKGQAVLVPEKAEFARLLLVG